MGNCRLIFGVVVQSLFFFHKILAVSFVIASLDFAAPMIATSCLLSVPRKGQILAFHRTSLWFCVCHGSCVETCCTSIIR